MIENKEKQTGLNDDSEDTSKIAAAWDIIKTIVGVGVFVILFRFFILQPFYIIGNSMLPDFENGEYLFINELSYHFTEPARGEVVVFRYPDASCKVFVEDNKIIKTIVQGPCTSYIKRVIGLPGETVIVNSGKVTIINDENPNGFTLTEDYIEQGVTTLGNVNMTLGEDEYFVLGDNREPNASSDSREWGPLNRDYIIGKAWLRLLPLDKINLIIRADY